jgi:hypothetical protein
LLVADVGEAGEVEAEVLADLGQVLVQVVAARLLNQVFH